MPASAKTATTTATAVPDTSIEHSESREWTEPSCSDTYPMGVYLPPIAAALIHVTSELAFILNSAPVHSEDSAATIR